MIINWLKLVIMALPTAFRKPVIVATLRAGVQQVEYVYAQFGAARDAARYNAHLNGQVCILRKALTDAFGGRYAFDIRSVPAVGADLWIYSDESPEGTCYVYDGENDESEIDAYLWDAETIDANPYTFWVEIPATMNADDTGIVRGILNNYKMIGKQFILIRN
jgi:hypothetical protein